MGIGLASDTAGSHRKRNLLESLDRQPYLWPKEHPPCDECCNKPVTAKATLAHRRYAEDRAAEEGKREPAVKELDLYGIVVDKVNVWQCVPVHF